MMKAPFGQRLRDAFFKRHNQPRCDGENLELLAAEQKQNELEARICSLEEQVGCIDSDMNELWNEKERRLEHSPEYLGSERRRSASRAH